MITLQWSEALRLQSLDEQTAQQRAERGGKRASQVVPGEYARSLLRRHHLRQRRLLDGKERTDLVAAGTDDADRGGREQKIKVVGRKEHRSGQGHKNRADDQHAFAADAIRGGRNPQRNGHIAEQRHAE